MESAPRPAQVQLPWGGSIWNNSPSALGPGFGSAVRDSSRPRGTLPAHKATPSANFHTHVGAENGSYMGAPSDHIEGKTGSGSLVPSSESDWNPNRTPWGDNTTTHARSSGVSPARRRSIAQAQPSQQYADAAPSNYFPVARTANLGQAPVAKPSSKPLLDPTTMNFTSARQSEAMASNAFSNFAFNPSDATQQRSEPSVGSWPDAASVHSPSDDRRSVAASEYFGPSSAAPSRSGSLPPSRHGAEPVQYGQTVDHFSRYMQPAPRQQSFSHASGRAFQERSGSIQSESLQMLGRMSLDHDSEPALMSHKPSMSIPGLPPSFTPAGDQLASARDAYSEAQALAREELGYQTAGVYTPDGFANGHLNDAAAQLRAFQFDSRSAPNGTATRQSPYYSHAHTPPVPFDHLNPYRSSNASLSNGTNLALLQDKLQVHQLQQERRGLVNPAMLHPQQLQHLLAANQLRNPYAYSYGMPNGMPMNAVPPNLGMPMAMSPMMDAPKAPREHNTQPEMTAMSGKLFAFKQAAKTNKKFELTDIYDHIVEFSGDQHGSRFIQQKLESANSDVKERVFRELHNDSLQLMQDVFGNYVIQKFFEHGDQSQKKILANRMKGHVVTLSLQMYGCRVVQKALEHVLTDQQAMLVKELEKDVMRCVKDQNGNHVIQKAIERVPMEHIQFIVQAFRGQVGTLSVHPYGCRVIQRMLEKVPEPDRRFILQELHAEGPRFFNDQYGNYVTQHIIEHGKPEDRAKIISLIKDQLLNFSKHKFASNVVERCLLYGSDDQRREIMLAVADKNERGESNLMSLIKDGYGNYVIQKMMDTLCRRDYDEFVTLLKPEMERAKKSGISGKQIISVEKKMHRFDRVDSVSPPTPPLTNDAQSPQSSSLPSANTSTVDEPVHHSNPANKDLAASHGIVSIENTS
ncbi:ARM repeat-containing protein [Corynespora cassiicola Philippines]|uniref:Pumilio homology domain family member 3 n=1 Tax=Corynespora cassiicola Philippines TaxID=1448308 RepID=A0A2T2NSU3_CORCC|nr:ARM repeat-containing protein [Corynespora cassiicola Philippines]